jgi:hypothetical protein
MGAGSRSLVDAGAMRVQTAPMEHRRGIRFGLAVSLIALIALGCVDLVPAASPGTTSSGETPGSESPAVESVSAAGESPLQSGPEVTVGPSKTKKPKRTPKPADTTMPTEAPTTEPTDTTTATDSPSATDTGAATPPASGGGIHLFSLPIAIQSLVIVPPSPQLNYGLPPNYGTSTLSAGFVPDPDGHGITSGGPVDVSYLGGSCSGFTTAAPDLRINFSGTSSLLRIYFIGTGDTTMVVNDPYGNFYCVDDSFGTLNPTIDFNNPAIGAYDVWIGSYASGTYVSGTLYATENSGNHP